MKDSEESSTSFEDSVTSLDFGEEMPGQDMQEETTREDLTSLNENTTFREEASTFTEKPQVILTMTKRVAKIASFLALGNFAVPSGASNKQSTVVSPEESTALSVSSSPNEGYTVRKVDVITMRGESIAATSRQRLRAHRGSLRGRRRRRPQQSENIEVLKPVAASSRD